ncbi:hypothetical protein SDC9_161952 [bioreactor metagenome]|uniref:Uncharacterized protein n=1 Tax=bioreactor metagenome TaxID=1076179 RepID=A0A645FJP7_9ZZZZ
MEKEQGYKDTIKAHVKELTELTNEERAVFRKTVEPVYDYFKANYKPEVSLDEIVAEVERIKTEKGIK